jgi:hypothetical protein
MMERKSALMFPSGPKGPVFDPLRDPKFFKKFFIETGTLAWPNGRHKRVDIETIARFGRHPHRNAVLGRQSTLDELDYLASGKLVHTRALPR